MTKHTFLDGLAETLTERAPARLAEGPAFRALEDLSLGDVCTDYFIRLGGEVKQDPGALARKALEALGPDIAPRASIEQGYVNIRLPDEDLAKIGSPLIETPARHEIIVAPRSRALDRLAYMRLFSIASLQTFSLALLGGRPLLEAGGERFDGDARSLGALLRFGSSAPENPGWAPAPLLEEKGSGATVWLAPEQLVPGRISEFFGKSSELKDRVRFRAPPAFWLRTREESDEAPPVTGRPEVELSALALLLASPDSADELDCAVAARKEGANLVWFLTSMEERSARLAAEASLDAGEAEPAPATDLERGIVARISLYPTHVAQCAVYGDAIALVTVTADLLSRSSRLINDPSLRHRHRHGTLGWWESWILKRFRALLGSDPLLARLVSIGRDM